MRIENNYLVTEAGLELLSPFPLDLALACRWTSRPAVGLFPPASGWRAAVVAFPFVGFPFAAFPVATACLEAVLGRCAGVAVRFVPNGQSTGGVTACRGGGSGATTSS
jgi:hypothetical protein